MKATKRNLIVLAAVAVTATIALAAAAGDRLKIPVKLGQGQAVTEQVIFDIGAGSANPLLQSTSGGTLQFSNNGTNLVSLPTITDTLATITNIPASGIVGIVSTAHGGTGAVGGSIIVTATVGDGTLASPATFNYVRVASSGAVQISCLPTGVDGEPVDITETSSGSINLVASGTCTGSSKILANSAGIVTITGLQSARLVYSTTSSSWEIMTALRHGGIENDDVLSSASIAYSKLNLSGSILNADVNASAAVAYSKLNLSGSILNADVNASAAIAYSKLNLATSIVNADVSASAAIAGSKLQAAGTSNAGTVSYEDHGTFNATFTGPCNSGSLSVTYSRAAGQVMLSVPLFNCTCTVGTTFSTSSILPAGLTPARTWVNTIGVQDTGATNKSGQIGVFSNGTIQIFNGMNAGNFTGNSTACGAPEFPNSISYSVY